MKPLFVNQTIIHYLTDFFAYLEAKHYNLTALLRYLSASWNLYK